MPKKQLNLTFFNVFGKTKIEKINNLLPGILYFWGFLD